MNKRPLAVVTGASSGIGAEFARQWAARGHDLLLIARRRERLEAVAEALTKEFGISAEVFVADLALDDHRAAATSRILTAENLAVLVNNAGFGTQGLFENADLASQDQMHRLHILATLDLTHAALTNFKTQEGLPGLRRGVINVSSVAGFEQAPFNVSYCATKAWINSFTKGLAMELAAEPGVGGTMIRMQALCPGYTYSEFHDVLRMDRRTIPETFWLKTSFVVSESLRGFDCGKLFVIPDWRYRGIVRLIQWIPSPWMRWISIRFARKRRERIQTFASKT